MAYKTRAALLFAITAAVILAQVSCSSHDTAYHMNSDGPSIVTGLERFVKGDIRQYRDKRVVLVTNHSGVDYQLQQNIQLLRNNGIRIAFVLAPEHGLYGYMNEYDRRLYQVNRKKNLLIYNMHKLDRASLKGLLKVADVVLFDIQDMGMRCYTYVSVLKFLMDTINDTDIELVVLDRPNPLGFLEIDGPYLDKKFYSRHISAFPSTFLYRMTPAEAAGYYKGEFARGVKLRVIPMKGYSKGMMYHETGLPWVPPSPNLPTYESSIVYSAVVLLEGVNISLGRGTTKPFEYVGAPWIHAEEMSNDLNSICNSNFRFRPVYFKPTFSKHRGKRCGGVQIFYTGGSFSPVQFSYMLTSYLHKKYPRHFKWERFRSRYDVDYLAGSHHYRKSIELGWSYQDYMMIVRHHMERFLEKSEKYYLY